MAVSRFLCGGRPRNSPSAGRCWGEEKVSERKKVLVATTGGVGEGKERREFLTRQ